MYKIKEVRNNSNQITCIEIENSDESSYAKIYLNLGASLQELKLKRKAIIEDLHPLAYNNTYASSILFPFANRIKDGHYTFDGKSFNFDINETGNNNAIHGLVFNKTFHVIEQQTSTTSASIKLLYEEKKNSLGFPFKYSIQIEYVLRNDSLDIHVLVTNTDNNTFPFTIGWHPYFSCTDLFNSSLNFDSTKQITFNNRFITNGIIDIKNESDFIIKDKQLDDCFILNSGKTQFNTPDYSLEINASSKENFLQIYTPPRANTIAIEPTTGVSDSFNNKIGLQTLKPNETYNVSWQVKLL